MVQYLCIIALYPYEKTAKTSRGAFYYKIFSNLKLFRLQSIYFLQYTAGEGVQYLSRAQAMKKLQLNLKDFRKLCILKGIYPREPRVRKRAQQGRAGIQTLYQKKDIQFLLHEPLIWKLRDTKVNKYVGLIILTYLCFFLYETHTTKTRLTIIP